MFDPDTFLTALYVKVDDFCKLLSSPTTRPGRNASLCGSEVVTLGIFGQWARFVSERAFYRYARRHLRQAFPTLPDYAQFNRLLRQHWAVIDGFFLHLVQQLGARDCPYESLDSSGVATRNSKRRGPGWLAGLANIGWSNRLGWFEDFRLLLSANPAGIITGFAFAPASTNDRAMAESFFALRCTPGESLPSVGAPAHGPYLLDKGFESLERARHWLADYAAQVIYSPQRKSRNAWPKPWRRLLASMRQSVETVFDKLHATFRLDRERPHELSGFQVRLSAKVALHNFCIWLNQQLQRPLLAFSDLVDW